MPYSRKIFCVAFTDDVHVEIIISVHTAKVNFCQTHTEKIIRSTCNNWIQEYNFCKNVTTAYNQNYR